MKKNTVFSPTLFSTDYFTPCRTNQKQKFASDNDLDFGKSSQEQVRRNPYMDLGTETNLQSQRHTRGKQLWDKVSDP